MLLNRVPLITMVLISLGSSIALAQPAPSPTPSPTPTHKPRQNFEYLGGLPKDLDLTPKQLQQIREIRRKNPAIERIRKEREELRQAQEEFLKLMAGTASQQQVSAKHHQINNLREQLANAEFEDDLEIRDVLTLAQRQKWAEHIQNRFPAPQNTPPQPR